MTEEHGVYTAQPQGDPAAVSANNYGLSPAPGEEAARLQGKVSISEAKKLLHRYMAAGVSYGLGRKAPSLHAEPGTFSEIDCSGFNRLLAFKASDGRIVEPDGSYTQHDWCIAQGFEACSYHDAGRQANPAKLFICFITPQSSPDGVGHVWFLNSGVTIESHGGRGPDSRRWDYHTLIEQVGACYLYPSEE